MSTGKPSHKVFVVESATCGGQPKGGFWTHVGSAWPHKDGKGLNVQLKPASPSRTHRPARVGGREERVQSEGSVEARRVPRMAVATLTMIPRPRLTPPRASSVGLRPLSRTSHYSCLTRAAGRARANGTWRLQQSWPMAHQQSRAGKATKAAGRATIRAYLQTGDTQWRTRLQR